MRTDGFLLLLEDLLVDAQDTDFCDKLHAIYVGLDYQLKAARDLIDFGYTTWKHDPIILEHFKGLHEGRQDGEESQTADSHSLDGELVDADGDGSGTMAEMQDEAADELTFPAH